MRGLLEIGKVPTTSGVDIRQPSTALFGVSSADRFLTSRLLATTPYPEWDAGTTYNTGDKVRQGELCYESIINANVNNDPSLTLDTDWIYTDPPLMYTSRPGDQTPFNFTLQSQQNFLTGYFTRIALTELVFTWAIPTITSRNDKIGIRYNTGIGPTKTGIVLATHGWKSLSDIAADLQAKVRAAAAPNLAAFTVVADAVTGSLTAATNSAETFAFVPVDPFINGAGTNPITKSQPERVQLYDMLNWAANVGTTAPTYTLATTQISGLPSLLSSKFIDITCSKLTANQQTRDGDTGSRPRDVLARVYLQGSADPLNPESLGSQPFAVYKEYSFPKQIAWDPKMPISNLEFTVYDDQGLILSTLETNSTNAIYDDKNQPDWSFTLLASEI